MKLTPEQIQKFKEINAKAGVFIADDELNTIAQSVAQFYLGLFVILQKNKKIDTPKAS